MKIYLDMDGCIVDFIDGCKKIFDWPRTPIRPMHDVPDHLGISNARFWKVIDSYGEDWWADLKPTSFADDLIDLVDVYDPEFTILTSPSKSHHAAAGKVIWLQRYFGKNFKRYIITPKINKQMLSHVPGAVLIDDYDGNCNDFNIHGKAVLVPTVWNSKHYCIDPVENVTDELSQIHRKS